MSRTANRFTSATLAILIQAVFLALLVLSRPPVSNPQTLSRELTLFLPRLPRLAAPAPRAAGNPVREESLPQAPAATIAPLIAPGPVAPSPEQLRNLGQSLFGCAPQTYASLTPLDRAHCPRPGEGVAIQEAPNLMGSRSHVKDEAHWAEEWAREQSPALLPCGGFTNVLCLLIKIADGSLSDYGDPSKWPHYAVKQLPKEDFYKVEQAYDAWHKDHPGKEANASAASGAASP